MSNEALRGRREHVGLAGKFCGALVIAEEIRAAVDHLEIPHEKSSSAGRVSISLGVATAEKNSSISYEDLIRQSDQALYLAKEKGRNRVEVYAESC